MDEMNAQQNYRMAMLARQYGQKVLDAEWKYFQEWSRYFKDYPPEKKYGILIWGSDLTEDNMLFSNDIGELRVLHCEKVCKEMNTGTDGMKQRKFIDWLEKMEGKQ